MDAELQVLRKKKKKGKQAREKKEERTWKAKVA